jgi:hypothetical protein
MEASEEIKWIKDVLPSKDAVPPAGLVSNFPLTLAPGMFRLMADLPHELGHELDRMVERLGCTHAEAVNRAISTMAYLDDAMAEGGELLLRNGEGRVARLVQTTPTRPWMEQMGELPTAPQPAGKRRGLWGWRR